MLQKVLIFLIFVSLSSCGLEKSKVLNDDEGSTDEGSTEDVLSQDSDSESNSTPKCTQANKRTKDLRSLLQDIDEMKKRANAYDISGVSGYCSGAQLSYMNEIDWDLAEWTGEAYEIVDALCDNITKVDWADASLSYARKTRPDDPEVIERSNRARSSVLDLLNQAEAIVKETVQASDQRAQKICEE